MDIATFHQRTIQGQGQAESRGEGDEPWTAALRRLCDFREPHSLVSSSSPAHAWSPWNGSSTDAPNTAMATWQSWLPLAQRSVSTIEPWTQWNPAVPARDETP